MYTQPPIETIRAEVGTIVKRTATLYRSLPNGKWWEPWVQRSNGKKRRKYFKEVLCECCASRVFTCNTRHPRNGYVLCSTKCRLDWLSKNGKPHWSGGFVTHSGYLHVRHDAPHPRMRRGGYVPLHVLEVEKALGRHLMRSERVHHIDGDKLNNDPDNLAVMTRNQHSSAHASVIGLLKGLIQAKVVWFDRSTNRYRSIHGELDIFAITENAKQRNWRRQARANGKPYKKVGLPSRAHLLKLLKQHDIKL